jgi:hypothetical protein
MNMPSKTEMIRTLRSLAGHRASMADCLKALRDAGDDLENAKVLLTERGLVDLPYGARNSALDVPDDAPEGWAYILAKVDSYLRLGVNIYRKGDALNMPDVAWDEDSLDSILNCFRQFASGKGYRADRPVENVGISGFTAALKTLHFRKVRQLAISLEGENQEEGKTTFLDKILFEHVAVDMSFWLFNKVVYDDSD